MSGPRIVYITGSGRSGSTILDMMLGANSGALSLGQVDEVRRWAAGKQNCTCGRPLPECPVWGPALAGGIPPASLNADRQVAKVTSMLPAVAGRAPRPADHGDVDATWRLYDRLAAVSGMDVLIDSSKTLLRYALLAADDRDRDLRMIHLVRDPRGFVLSRTRAKEVPTASGRVGSTTSQSLVSALADWTVQNALVSAYARRQRPDSIVVTYEQLVGDPLPTLRRLCEFAGLEFQPDAQLPPFSEQFHLIAGNSSRFQFSELRLDERWRRDLPGWQRRLTEASAGPLHERLRSRASG